LRTVGALLRKEGSGLKLGEAEGVLAELGEVAESEEKGAEVLHRELEEGHLQRAEQEEVRAPGEHIE